MMTTEQFEDKVFDVDKVRIVLRTSKYKTTFEDYPYVRKAGDKTSINDWLDTRIKSLIGDCEVVVIDGSGQYPHGNTNMETVRKSYSV